jgi:zinc transport system substrate-binding protein
MRNYLSITALIILALSCSNPRQQGKKVIAVSILPQKYFVEKIGGNDFETEVLVAPGASHETYDPTPQQMVRLGDAALWLKNGNLAFEEQWEPKFLSSHPQLKTLDWSEGIQLIAGEDHHEEAAEEEHHGGIDPHYWLSPRQALVLAQNTAKALEEINPEKATEYRQNLNQLQKRIQSLDSMATAAFSTLSGRSFMIFHPALTYFAQDYGLKQIAVEQGGNAPTARGLRQFIDMARKENIKVILVQQQFDRENAETIAREIGAKVIPFDPMAENWENNMLSIIKMMQEAMQNSQP